MRCSCSCTVVVAVVAVVYVPVCLQAWKRSYSARLPQFFTLAISKDAEILGGPLKFWTWQRQKWNSAARRQTSSSFQDDSIKMKQFCETSFKHAKLNAELTASRQFVKRFSHSTCLKYCARHEKNRCQVKGSAVPVTQNHSKPEYLMFENATILQEISALTS